MVATIIGLVVIALFIGAVYGSKRLNEKMLGRSVTVIDALFFTVIVIGIMVIVASVAKSIGEQVLALF